MLSIEPHPEGAILPVRAQPGARRNEIRGEQDGALKVCVSQSPGSRNGDAACFGKQGRNNWLRPCFNFQANWQSEGNLVAVLGWGCYT